jgi:hypothetical protein
MHRRSNADRLAPRAAWRLALAAAFITQLACGGSSSPTSPTANLNLGGTWAGSWQFVTSGVAVSDAVTATFTQTGSSVSGTWRAESGASGQFPQLAPQASTSGTVTVSQTTITGTVCNGTASVTGTASASALELTVAQIPPSGLCQWASSMQFSLRKQ